MAGNQEVDQLIADVGPIEVGHQHQLEQVVVMGAVEGSTMAMNQLDLVLEGLREYAQGKGTRVELIDDTHVRITRLVEGPRELVWRAHLESALLEKWMLGPDGWRMTECEPGPDQQQAHESEQRLIAQPSQCRIHPATPRPYPPRSARSAS